MDPIKAAASRRSFITASLAGGVVLALQPVASHSQQRSSRMQPTIAVDTDFATQINIATVEPENQAKLVQLLREATDGMFSKMPGWISTSILKGKDGRRVFIYSQWRSAADIEAFRKDPNIGRYLQDITAIAKFEAAACDVVYAEHA
jgi:heme-degrading monooxygenase HmoA